MTNPSREIPEDEINFGAIGSKINSAIVYPFKLYSKSLPTTLLFVVVSILICVALKYTLPKTYKSSFVIRPNDPKEKFHLKIIADLQLLLKNKDFVTLASELKLPNEMVTSIAGLQTYNPTYKNTLDSINSTEITIITTDFTTFVPVQNAVIKYVESSPYFAKISALQKEQVRIQLDQVNKDLSQLDSLKQIQLKNQKSATSAQGNILVNELINPTAAYAMAIERTNKKTALLAQQMFDTNFQLVKNCITVKHHSSPPRILLMCLYAIPISLLLCFLFLHIKTKIRN